MPTRAPKHNPRTVRVKRQDNERMNSRERGYTWRWQKARAYHLKCFPLCAECKRNGRLTAAEVVDHIEPHRGDQAKFWDRDNWQSLCKRCHAEKTAKERDGWAKR